MREASSDSEADRAVAGARGRDVVASSRLGPGGGAPRAGRRRGGALEHARRGGTSADGGWRVKKRVLLVEDEAGTRTALREFLERAGFLAAEAADGLAGLAQAESWHPHAILLDVRLPGLDGYEVCRRLTANPATKPIPVIVMTAFQSEKHKSR